MRKKFLDILAVTMFLMCQACSYALPFNIVPDPSKPFPSVVNPGIPVLIYYLVTNSTGITLNDNYVKYLPYHVSQIYQDNAVSNLCGPLFTLTSGQTCTLELRAVNAVDPNGPVRDHLFVCTRDKKTCNGSFTLIALYSTGWSSDNFPSASAISLAVLFAQGTTLYVGGENTSTNPALWTGSGPSGSWTTTAILPTTYGSGSVLAIIAGSNSCLVMGGQGSTNGWVGYLNSGSTTHDLTNNLSSATTQVTALALSPSGLYAGFNKTGSVSGVSLCVSSSICQQPNCLWSSTGLTDNNGGPNTLASLVYNGQLYAGGTNTTGASYGEVLMYQGSGTWANTGLPTAAMSALNALISTPNNQTLYAGGVNSSGTGQIWQYSISNGSWVSLNFIENATINALALDNYGVLYAVGTTPGGGAVWRYIPTQGLWQNLGLAYSNSLVSIAVDSSNNIYVGGTDNNNNPFVWVRKFNV